MRWRGCCYVFWSSPGRGCGLCGAPGLSGLGGGGQTVIKDSHLSHIICSCLLQPPHLLPTSTHHPTGPYPGSQLGGATVTNALFVNNGRELIDEWLLKDILGHLSERGY